VFLLAVIAVLLFLLVLLTRAKSKLGAFLVWPVLFVYPNGWWETANLVPAGVGYDDLFVVLMATVVALRSRRAKIGWPVKVLLSYAVLVAISNIVGWAAYGGGEEVFRVVMHDSGKILIFAMVGFCVVNSLETERDVRWLVGVMALSISMTAVTVIASRYSPAVALTFSSSAKEVGVSAEGYRAAGSLSEPNMVGSVMAVGLCLLVLQLKFSRGLLTVGACACQGALMLVAVLVSASRSGAIGILVLLPTMLALRRMRGLAIGTAVLLLAVGALTPSLTAPIKDRVESTFDKDSGEVVGVEGARVTIWLSQLSRIEPAWLFVGHGRMQTTLRTGGQPHNGYLDLLCWYGLPGVVWLVSMLLGFVRRIRLLLGTTGNPMAVAVGQTMTLYLSALLWFSLWTDLFAPGSIEQVLLVAVLGITDRMVALSHQATSRSGKTSLARIWPYRPTMKAYARGLVRFRH
jgi:hypothetical protein